MNRYFEIHGMDCAEEVAVHKSELGPLVGDERFLTFDVLNGRMGVLVPETGLSSASALQTVSRTGMSAGPWQDTSAHREISATWWERFGRTTLTVLDGLRQLRSQPGTGELPELLAQ